MLNHHSAHAQHYFRQLQEDLVHRFETMESGRLFQKTPWDHQTYQGGGITCLLAGLRLEKAAVNFSCLEGSALPKAALDNHASHFKNHPCFSDSHQNIPYHVMGVSCIVHPKNPFVPTTHFNVRCFVLPEQKNWWFGGGFDLTPYYSFPQDNQHWHQKAKWACDFLSPDAYPRYKQDCDTYFYLPHRQEPRGIGGIFFDELNQGDFDTCLMFIQKVASAFIDAYQSIYEKRCIIPYDRHHRAFQSYRRGRYAEFNLLYDRGTKFGLESNGRTESILASMPPYVRWPVRLSKRWIRDERQLKQALEPRCWLDIDFE